MTNQDLANLRKHLGLSREQMVRLLPDPDTKRHITSSTLYRWEKKLPEVFAIPFGVACAAKLLEAKARKAGYQPLPHVGDRRNVRDPHTGAIHVEVFNGKAWRPESIQ